MVARTIINKRHDAAVERIEAHARSIAEDDPETVELAERVRDARGPDEMHTRLFRLEAVADLMERLDELTEGRVADPLETKTVPELKEIAEDKGVDRPYELRKGQLIEAIRQKESEEDPEDSDSDGESEQ